MLTPHASPRPCSPRPPAERFPIGNLQVSTQHPYEFQAGYQCGYYQFRLRYRFLLVPAQEITHFLTKQINAAATEDWKAGFITGWYSALFEPPFPSPAHQGHPFGRARVLALTGEEVQP
jgi:hypothetical protein